MKRRKLIRSLISWALLSPILAASLFPFVVMTIGAVKSVSDESWWSTLGIERAFLNSLYVSALTTLLTIAVATPAAYALSRARFIGRGAVRHFLLVSSLLSPIALAPGLLPLAAKVGLADSVSGLTPLYVGFNVGLCVWMLQACFATFSRDFEETIWLEGASRTRALWVAFLPAAKPALAATALFTFVNAWNEFVIALILLKREDSYTLPVRIFSVASSREGADWPHVMAAALLASIPVAIIFAWLQKYLARGVAFGAGR